MAEEPDDKIGDGSHRAHGRRTLLHAYAHAMVRWTGNLQGGFDPFPNVARFMERMKPGSGVQAALTREQAGQLWGRAACFIYNKPCSPGSTNHGVETVGNRLRQRVYRRDGG